MNEFIIKTNYQADLKQAIIDLQNILLQTPWPVKNQISLKHRPGCNSWDDGIGSLYNKEKEQFYETESSFTEWNEKTPIYTRGLVQQLERKYNFISGRVRLMRLLPKTGLTVHKDMEQRFHLPLITNPKCYFFEVTDNIPTGVHIDSDGYFYLIDTTRDHFVYNGSLEERIHLVVNVASWLK